MSCDLKINFKNDQVMYCPGGCLEGEYVNNFLKVVAIKFYESQREHENY